MFIYQSPPLDNWDGMLLLHEAIAKLTPNDEAPFTGADLIKLAMNCAFRVAKAKESSWEGDIRGNDLYVFVLPDPDAQTCRYGIAWKQDNNGTTFICSPVALPWLQDELLEGEP